MEIRNFSMTVSTKPAKFALALPVVAALQCAASGAKVALSVAWVLARRATEMAAVSTHSFALVSVFAMILASFTAEVSPGQDVGQIGPRLDDLFVQVAWQVAFMSAMTHKVALFETTIESAFNEITQFCQHDHNHFPRVIGAQH